jgi:secondary thiamine-phosphate synthase enzyme
MKSFFINSEKRIEFIDITDKVQRLVDAGGVENGIIFLYVPHTTAGLTINENYDKSVKHDIIKKLSNLVPEDDNYSHSEGNSDSHIKSSLIGNEIFLFIENKKIILGRWQGLFFCEFDGPRKREIYFLIK